VFPIARIIIIVLLWGTFDLAGLSFLIKRLRRFLRWHRETLTPTYKQMLLLLPALALSILIFGQALVRTAKEVPAEWADLKTITAPVESVREYESHQVSGRSIQIVKRYYIYLEGYSGSLHVPNNFRFDQDAFLAWAGPEEITFYYARTGGRLVAYQIQRGDDEVFLDFQWANEQLTVTFLSHLLTMLAVLLFALGGSFTLPEFLHTKDRAVRHERRAALAFIALLVVLLIGVRFVSKPTVTDTPADTAPQLKEIVSYNLSVTLPRGWQKYSVDGETQWYKAQKGVSTCFRLAEYIGGSAGEDWYDDFLSDYRDFLLEDFIEKPKTSVGPFLEVYISSADRVPGTDYLVAEGWGTSVNDYKNHFLLVLLPERDCAVVIHSSSGSLSWKNLEEYAAKWVWPLLGGFTVGEGILP
jgi:hypothetical protein